ncbi:MAG: LysR family transcriptional regulator [Labilithrix sp.]|nr:LysR family transcriptional regulator [Labilithrix sp.]MBX3216219.1 LysR family transcriptional regulator [Labilithrix sp.]
MSTSRTSAEDIVAMATYAAVVEAKSFTDAARALGVSKSVVSARVSRLEERLGVLLLLRTTRRFALTADGVRLYERCARVVAAADEAAQTIDDVSDAPRGVLRVHAPLAFAEAQLAQPIAEFARAHPNLKLDLRLDDRTPDIASEGLDLAIVLTEKLSESWLVARKLASDRVVVCAAPGYLRRRGIPFRPQDLIHHQRISHARRQDQWQFTTDEGPLTLDPSADLVVDSTAFMREAAVAEHGLAMLPSSVVAAELDSGRLRVVLDHFHDLSLGIYTVHHHARFVPARVRVFVDHLARCLRKPAWQRDAGKVDASASTHDVKLAGEGAARRTSRRGARETARARAIPMTEQDVRRLSEVAAIYRDVDPPAAERLLDALGRTQIVTAATMPPSVVTMNSRCVLRDRAGRERETALVYPWDAGETRVSVLSDLGEAMLGAPVGVTLPAGSLEAIRYQPEAAGDHHL